MTPSRTHESVTSTSSQVPTPTVTPPLPTLTIGPSPTSMQAATPPPLTETVEPSLTPSQTPTSKPTQPTENPGPGLVVRGYIKLANGTPVENVNIYLAFASYDGTIVATTNSNGYFSCDYIYIPSDETVRVWAEAAGYSFKPADGSAVWTGTEFYWRHYLGFEERDLDFTAISEPILK